MFIQQVKCDVCGKISDFKDHETLYLKMTLKPVYHTKFASSLEASDLGDLGFITADDTHEKYTKYFDLCSDCVQKLVSFLNHEDTH